MHQLRVPEEVVKLIRGLHPDLKKKIRQALQGILSDPQSGKALREELDGLRSYRVRRFRIVYRISDKKEVEVVAIGPRERIYEETFRILHKPE